jgi:hypothetical protein
MPTRRTRIRREWSTVLRRLRHWQRQAVRAWLRARATPLWLRIAVIAVVVFALLGVLTATVLVYHVARKPTEMLFPMSAAFKKTPVGTWNQYGAFFREYATATVTPELLAALAQMEGAGNPVARTYWRWHWSWNPFAIYQPASSAVGMYQMTDAAFAEARRYCIRDHLVVEDRCWGNDLYTRVLPSHAVELTAVYLDRSVASILAHRPRATVTPQQKQDLATLIHLCGATSANAFARRGFHLAAGERCGDHDAATYLNQLKALKRQFLRLAAEE